VKPSDDPERVRERVRYHRLRKRLKPKVAPLPTDDPWELANEALILMAAAKAGLRKPELIAKQEQAMEIVRMIAWGPDKD
jgi:hypothetical protein